MKTTLGIRWWKRNVRRYSLRATRVRTTSSLVAGVLLWFVLLTDPNFAQWQRRGAIMRVSCLVSVRRHVRLPLAVRLPPHGCGLLAALRPPPRTLPNRRLWWRSLFHSRMCKTSPTLSSSRIAPLPGGHRFNVCVREAAASPIAYLHVLLLLLRLPSAFGIIQSGMIGCYRSHVCCVCRFIQQGCSRKRFRPILIA